MNPKAPADWNLGGTQPWVVKDGQGPQLCLEVPPAQALRERGQACGRHDRIPERAESDWNWTWGFVWAQIIHEERRPRLGEGRTPGGKGRALPRLLLGPASGWHCRTRSRATLLHA